MMVKWFLTLPGYLFAFDLFVYSPMASLASTCSTAFAENSHHRQHELTTYRALEFERKLDIPTGYNVDIQKFVYLHVYCTEWICYTEYFSMCDHES